MVLMPVYHKTLLTPFAGTWVNEQEARLSLWLS